MRHKGVFAVVCAGIGAASVLVAAPAGAQVEELPLTVDPPSGPEGTVITVSGSGCNSENPDDAPEVDVILADEAFFTTPDQGEVIADALVEPESDGSWSAQLTVPEGTDPDTTWLISALCFASPEAPEPLAVYEIVEFDVTGPPTPPPTTPPPTTPPPEAPPAPPVVEEPEFTG